MSVRRLADDVFQPEYFRFNRANASAAKKWISKYPKGRQASAVIPLLMIAQEQEGWVTKASIEYVAEMLSMPYIRVLEVATFYTQFMLQPVGTKAHIQVCGTTPCMLRGSEELMEVCKRKIDENQFATNSDGTLSWEEVECQGACVNAPMVMIFKDSYEDLTPQRLEEIIDMFEAGEGSSITPGPQIDRHYSAPCGGPVTLLENPDTDPVSVAKVTINKAKASSRTNSEPVGPLYLAKPEGKADDLKRIIGIGPKIEKRLNKLGLWHFSQIAQWTDKDIAIMDEALSFKGRIERDEWVKQAKALTRKS